MQVKRIPISPPYSRSKWHTTLPQILFPEAKISYNVYGFPMLPGLRGTGLNPSTSLSQAGAVQTWLRPGNMGRSDRRELSREPRCYVTYELNLLNLQVLLYSCILLQST